MGPVRGQAVDLVQQATGGVAGKRVAVWGITFKVGTDSAIAAAAGADDIMVFTAWPEFAQADPSEEAKVVGETAVVDACQGISLGCWSAAGWRTCAKTSGVKTCTKMWTSENQTVPATPLDLR